MEVSCCNGRVLQVELNEGVAPKAIGVFCCMASLTAGFGGPIAATIYNVGAPAIAVSSIASEACAAFTGYQAVQFGVHKVTVLEPVAKIVQQPGSEEALNVEAVQYVEVKDNSILSLIAKCINFCASKPCSGPSTRRDYTAL